MTGLDERQALRILELAPGASQEDIHRAYHQLRRLHGRDGAVFAAPAMEEFSGEARLAVLEQLDAAYALLSALAPAAPAPPSAQPEAGSGTLRQARAAAGLSLEQVAAETHVRVEYLSALEEEHFERLRLAAVNVRGYLTAYVNAIGLAAEEAVPPYMEKFLEWQARSGR